MCKRDREKEREIWCATVCLKAALRELLTGHS